MCSKNKSPIVLPDIIVTENVLLPHGSLCKVGQSMANLRTGVSKSRYFGISIPIKYSKFSRFYKKMGPFQSVAISFFLIRYDIDTI